MPGSQLHVHLYRDSFNTPWGFRLQGGKDLSQALTVQRVFSNSPAEGELQRGDIILAIGGEATIQFSHKQAQDAIKNSGGQINLVVNRPPPGSVHISPISPPIVTQRPRAPSLQDRSPQNSSPRRPQNFQNTQPSHNYSHQNSNSHYYNNNMRQHNVPIHVHIEPSRPQQRGQTTYYLQNPSNNPYATAPRRQRGYSQPPYQSPTTPTIPPPPWASQQTAPKKVSKLSKLGGGGDFIGTSFKSSTLPRYASQPSVAQYHPRRPEPARDEVDTPDLFEERRPTGPPPKVCSLSRLGGGDINFASGLQESQTLPRRNIPRRLSQPPSMPSRSYQAPQSFGSDYGRPATAAQRYEPASQNGVMLNRVQSSLDNITLSPRTPEVGQGGPFYQPPPQQQPAQFYTPTSLLLEQQKMQEQKQRQQQQQQRQPQPQYQPQPVYHAPPPPPPQQQQDEAEEGEEPIVPVWERRKQFQEPVPRGKAAVRTPRGNPVPKVQRPAPGKTSYADFGLSYRPENKQKSSAIWQPSPQAKPAPPPQAQPQVIHYSSAPAGPAYAPVKSPVKTAPPPWKRAQDSDDETDGTPAWRNTLRTTGVKPWDVDLNYCQDAAQEEAQRSVPFNPTPYQTMYAPQNPGADASDGGPKVVHLQYNSPMGLYSNENVAETYRGQMDGLAAQQTNAPQQQANDQQGQGQGLPGGRDWSQSQVLRFIQQDTKKPKGAPATAPKPHHAVRQPQPQPKPKPQPQKKQPPPPPQPQQQPQSYQDEIGISDF